MRWRPGLLVLALALSGCSAEPPRGTKEFLELPEGGSESIRGQRILYDEISIARNATLVIEDSFVTLTDQLYVLGSLTMRNSTLLFDAGNYNGNLRVYPNASIQATGSWLRGADWFEVFGNVDWEGGGVSVGRLAINGTIRLSATELFASGEVEDDGLAAPAPIHVHGGRLDLVLATVAAPQQSLMAEPGTQVVLFDTPYPEDELNGPGRFEVAWTHWVAVRDAGGSPVAGANVTLASNGGLAIDSSADTNESGVARLRAVALVVDGRVPMPREPHTVLVDGVPAAVILMPSASNNRTDVMWPA